MNYTAARFMISWVWHDWGFEGVENRQADTGKTEAG